MRVEGAATSAHAFNRFRDIARAYSVRDTRLIYLKDDPHWRDLRTRPRFIALVKKMVPDNFGRGPSPVWGGTLILGVVPLRALGSLAAEFFTQRFSIWLALVGITVFAFGWRQVRHWWLPFSLLLLSIPLPALITNKLAIPLQFRASKYGYALIEWRHIPVRQQGNVIVIAGQEPGQIFKLFVAEGCSRLRSPPAVLAAGVVYGGEEPPLDNGGGGIVSVGAFVDVLAPGDAAADTAPLAMLPPVRIPVDNPMSAAKVELGRMLFFAARRSGNASTCGAPCHPPPRPQAPRGARTNPSRHFQLCNRAS